MAASHEAAFYWMAAMGHVVKCPILMKVRRATAKSMLNHDMISARMNKARRKMLNFDESVT